MPTPITNSVHYVKFLRGLESNWERLKQTPNKIDDDTLYFIYENPQNATEGKLYLGQKLISGSSSSSGNISLNDIDGIYIDDQTLANKQLLIYNETTDDWENASLSTIINDVSSDIVNIINSNVTTMTGATAAADGQSGLVPTPHAGDQEKILTGNGDWTGLDSNIFIKQSNQITLQGYSNAAIGSVPIKTLQGISWQQPNSSQINRTIISQADLDALIENGIADENTIYMVRNSEDSSSSNLYDEYFVIAGKLERLGTFGNVNLSDYVTNTVFQTTIGNLQNNLNNINNTLIPGLDTRLSTVENNYITKTEIGDLQNLLYSSNNASQTLVEEVNIINDRLTWQEIAEQDG